MQSDVSDDVCSCALFVHWNICTQIVNRTFMHKRLTNILDVSLLSVCAQTFDVYFGRPFLVHLWKKRLTDILERKGKENSMKIKKIAFSENVSNYHKKISIHWTANGQQAVVRCVSAQTVTWADLYPFAVRTSGVRLLSEFLLCT